MMKNNKILPISLQVPIPLSKFRLPSLWFHIISGHPQIHFTNLIFPPHLNACYIWKKKKGRMSERQSGRSDGSTLRLLETSKVSGSLNLLALRWVISVIEPLPLGPSPSPCHWSMRHPKDLRVQRLNRLFWPTTSPSKPRISLGHL